MKHKVRQHRHIPFISALIVAVGLLAPPALHAQVRDASRSTAAMTIAERVNYLARRFPNSGTDSLLLSPGRAHRYTAKDETFQRLARYAGDGGDGRRAEIVAALEAAARHFLEELPLWPPEGELAIMGESAYASGGMCAVALLLAEYDNDGSALPIIARLHARHRQASGMCREGNVAISSFSVSIPGDVFRNAEIMLLDRLATRWPAGTSAPGHLSEALAAYRGFSYERARYTAPGDRAFGWLQEELFYISLLALSPDTPERQYFQQRLEAVRNTGFRSVSSVNFEPMTIVEFSGERAGISYALPYFARVSMNPARVGHWGPLSNSIAPPEGEAGSMLLLPGRAQAGAPDSE